MLCSSQSFQYFDRSNLNSEELYLSTYLSHLRNSDGFQLLDVRNDSMMPSRVCVKIKKLQKSFLKMSYVFRKKWVTIDDIHEFKVKDEEIHGECTEDGFGLHLDGCFNGCCHCNNCHVGLWSCNTGIMKTADKNIWRKLWRT